MSVLKIVIYLVLISLGIWAGKGFYTAKREAEARANPTNDVSTAVSKPLPAANPINALGTNQTILETNQLSGTSNGVLSATEATNVISTSTLTNAAAHRGTNSVPSTNHAIQPKTAPEVVAAASNSVSQPTMERGSGASAESSNLPGATAGGLVGGAGVGYGKMIRYFGGFVLMAIILGMMVAHEISQFFGHKAMGFLFNDEGEGMRNPEYEEAEQVWVNGDYLGAIQLMRDYFKKYPRELYVAMRIAEIYEKDLGNYLAATLEYESILQYKFDRQRWGWAAIHLCNLYSKMGRTDQAIELLYKIHHDYGETPAAAKARKRLVQIDPNFDAVGEAIEEAESQAPDEPEAAPELKEAPSNLPPGFRPKKK